MSPGLYDGLRVWLKFQPNLGIFTIRRRADKNSGRKMFVHTVDGSEIRLTNR